MSISRRQLAAWLPGLIAGPQVSPEELHSSGYEFNSLPVRESRGGKMRSRPVFNGFTTRAQRVTLHISELAPGEVPHAPERQKHDEVIIIREGTLEATLNGKVTILGPGSVIFSGYNELNGWKNVGTTTAQYYVLSLEERKTESTG